MPKHAALVVDLVRHARSVANVTSTYCNERNDPLHATGVSALTRLKERLAGVDYLACYTSPYRRCIETARALVEPRPLVIQQDEALREMEHGPWHALTAEEVRARFPEHARLWDVAPHELDIPGRETLATVRKRVMNWLSGVRRAIPQGTVLVVSHQAIIRVLVAAHRGMPLSKVRSIAVLNLRRFRLQFPPLA